MYKLIILLYYVVSNHIHVTLYQITLKLPWNCQRIWFLYQWTVLVSFPVVCLITKGKFTNDSKFQKITLLSNYLFCFDLHI